MDLTIVGCGKMGEAILGGLLRAGRLKPKDIVATSDQAGVREALTETYGVRTLSDNVAAVSVADVVLVALKPHVMPVVLDTDDLRAALAGKLVVSIAAGVPLRALREWLPRSRLVRAMPNTPCLIGEGMTVCAPDANISQAECTRIVELFEAVGRCMTMDEGKMDVVTGLSGSGPAFAYLVVDALADGAVSMGLPRAEAVEIAAQMLQGSARMVLETGLHPAELKDRVTTPGGTTIAGLLALENHGVRAGLAHAVIEATEVAATLAAKACTLAAKA